MKKRSIHQEAEENTSEGRFLQVPGTECERESSRGYSTPSGRSASSRSRIHFKTAVQMLAPVVWSRIYAKKEKPDATTANSYWIRDVTTPLNYGKEVEPLRLEEELDIHHLETLMFKFMSHVPDQVAMKSWLAQQGSTLRVPSRFHSAGLMTQEEFQEMLADLLGVETWDKQKVAVFEREIEILFRKVDIASDGLVDWDEFCTYLMLQFEENDQAAKVNGSTFSPKPNIVRIDYNKETTTKILTDFNPMRYVTISKEGIIGVWSTELELQRKIEMEQSNSEADRTSSKRHIKMWVTDAVAMSNVHKMALATTNRDVYFYDMSTPIYTPQFRLCALADVVLCLDYYYNRKVPTGKSVLFLGMDNGFILFLVFSTPLKGLFETPFKKTSGSHQIPLQDLPSHSRFVTLQTLGQVHSDWVRRVKYIAVKEFVISCSGSGKESLVVRDIDDKKRKTYTFKVAKGIECFDYSHSLNVICTGGVDHAVRLWNPYVTAKPVAIMKGHQSSIIDLVIHEALEQVFSYDKEGVLKAWDVKEQVCLQTIAIKFPFGHRIPEHGPFPFFLITSPINSLFVTSNDCLAEIKITAMSAIKRNKTTHWKPLCAALYNPNMGQVITGCQGSDITFWDLHTGRQAQHIAEAHGMEEMSCMTMDSLGRCLLTGDRSGNVQIWNASNGHLLNKLERVEEKEVTGIISLPEKSKIVTVGWNRKVVVYYDNNQSFSLRPSQSWKGGHLHQDDILTAAYCPPNYLATASFDGDIILWGLDREKMIRRLKKGSGSLLKAKIMKLGLVQNRYSCASGLPVDKLLFLTSRAHWKTQESAVLISSEAGYLEFWCLYRANEPMGRFHAACEVETTVPALATDPSNEILVSGDSLGYITVYDISSYCISRAEAIVAQVWSTTQHVGNSDDNPEGKPPQLSRWHAHQGTVVSVEYLSLEQGALLLTASEDCTARLWTLEGQYIGMFGQKMLWNLDDLSSCRLPGKTWNEDRTSSRAIKCSIFPSELSNHAKSEPPSPTRPTYLSVSQVPPSSESISSDECESNFLPPIEARKEGKDGSEEDPYSWRKTNYYRSMTSLVLERSSKEPKSWSILGDHYNKDFRRRMETRQSRRDQVGNVDRKLTIGGGLGNSCSPFQALHIPDTKEYELPKSMPVTPRMIQKACHSPADYLWTTPRQYAIPPIPAALRRSESFLTMAESTTGNTS
ncbi:WD repeat-containing protein on Y chromosome-like isoform X1 [Acropora millepora]|uniref:WD repeat-containing protein on Y chromosome-like isoform X1 n=2 Tax=Acropora millepora TaxID=45264 RepID=UPI001CF1A426|nr:WD repeat-containing protein on Y chromosome-like isoform X1 [Acropora millepora]